MNNTVSYEQILALKAEQPAAPFQLPPVRVSSNIGMWLSAALEDPMACDEFKADIEAWFKAGEPGWVKQPAAQGEPTSRTARAMELTKQAHAGCDASCAVCRGAHAQPAQGELVATDAISVALRSALAWGMVYGPVIPASQWDEMRETQVRQLSQQIASANPSPAAQVPTRVIGVSRDAESPGMKTVLVAFDRTLTDDELRSFHEHLSASPKPPEPPAQVFFVRDVAELIKSTVPEVCKTLVRLGFPPRSTNMKISPDEALAVAAVLAPAQEVIQSKLADEVVGCFYAAAAEGLTQVLAETTDERLKDLVERRLMHALYAAEAAQAPAQAVEQAVAAEPKPLAKINRLCKAGLCIDADSSHEPDCKWATPGVQAEKGGAL